MKRLILLVALMMAMAVLAPAAFADDDTDEVEGADIETEEKDPSAAQLWKAQMIADYFAVDQESGANEDEITYVETLRYGGESGDIAGWGVVFKLMLYDSDGVKGEGGWAIGHLRKNYTGDAELHKNNLGQAHQASKDKAEKPEKVMPSQSNKDKQKHEG